MILNAALAPLLAVFLVAVGAVERAFAQSLVADLSAHEIAITAGFSGTELLLFGATEGDGDVIVVVRGPNATMNVRRKSRVLGIWINTESMRFHEVPSFYRVASSKPIDQITTAGMRQRLQIGIDAVRARPARETSPERLAEFRGGLIRNKVRDQLWDDAPAQVNFLGPKLFRTTIKFPPNVPTGNYMVEVFLVKDGREVGGQTTPMRVKKTGIGATIYDFAHQRAALYGLVAVLVAVVAGWSASAAFRRG
ncbi:MAG: TIGR02186 family protein [Alphaproteobacteria bacterium]|nr:TIGR02186 family protein [Alphaproteobacteria bacterium]